MVLTWGNNPIRAEDALIAPDLFTNIMAGGVERSTVAEKYKFVYAGRFLSYGQISLIRWPISLLRSDFSYTLADFSPTVRFLSYADRFLSYGHISLLRWPISLSLSLTVSGSFTPSRHLRPYSGREHTTV